MRLFRLAFDMYCILSVIYFLLVLIIQYIWAFILLLTFKAL